MESKEENANIAGVSGITRSGRVFALVPTPSNNNNESSSKAQGKQEVNEDQGNNATQKETRANEVGEFLRLVKKSDYKVVDQLNQTPLNIYMLALIMSYEAHREALMKF